MLKGGIQKNKDRNSAVRKRMVAPVVLKGGIQKNKDRNPLPATCDQWAPQWLKGGIQKNKDRNPAPRPPTKPR